MGLFRRALRDAPGSSYPSLPVHSLAPATTASYAQALTRLLTRARDLQQPQSLRRILASVPTATPSAPASLDSLYYTDLVSARTALSSLLLHYVHSGFSGSYARQLLSAVRLLERLRWIEPIVTPADWMAVKYIERGRPGIVPTRHWYDFEFVAALAARASSEGAWEALCLAVLSACHLLRVSEALTAKRTPGGQLYFRGCKSRRGEHKVDVGPFAQRWLRCLGELRRRRGVGAASCFFSSADGLQRALADLSAGTRYAGFRWHALRRFGAAQLHAAGLRLPLLQVYGGWASPREALRYAQPDSSWRFVSRTAAPTPVLQGRQWKAVEGVWPSGALWSPWVRRELQAPNLSPVSPKGRKRSRSQPDMRDAQSEGEDSEGD